MKKDDKVEVAVQVGDHKVVVIVGMSADREAVSRAIIEAINDDVDCPATVILDESGSIVQVPVEELVIRVEPMESLENFKIRHGLTEKKERRRGQRKMNFPRK